MCILYYYNSVKKKKKGEIMVKLKSMSFQNKQEQAFTLAEVLITLGIIGVVAALTLPSLINRTKNRELHTAFLKTYS